MLKAVMRRRPNRYLAKMGRCRRHERRRLLAAAGDNIFAIRWRAAKPGQFIDEVEDILSDTPALVIDQAGVEGDVQDRLRERVPVVRGWFTEHTRAPGDYNGEHANVKIG